VRIAVVSDIHGNWPALQAVAAEIAGERPDLVVNLGDILSGPLWPRETAAWLMRQGGDVQLVHGTPQVDHEPLLATSSPAPCGHARRRPG
jgi:predicted phosphodiesterase